MAEEFYTISDCIGEFYQKLGLKEPENKSEDYKKLNEMFKRMGLETEWKKLRKELMGKKV